MSLLREIQDTAVDGASDLESLLRKCRVLATRLKHDELKNWVICELDGYPNDVEVPQYRKLAGSCYGHFAGYGGNQVRNAPVPVTSIPEQLRHALTHWEIRQGVSALKSMLDTCDGMNLDTGWPAEANGKHHQKCLEESLQLQKRLRQLTHRVIAAQENDRQNISRELQDEIGQTLLGINVRLLSLKQQSRSNAKGLKNEIATTQRLVLKSARSVRRVAREFGNS